jgi:hypothetical protein
MPRANSTLMGRIATLRSDARTLHLDLRNAGDKELADAIYRVVTELSHPTITGAEGTHGVNHDAVRR